MLINALSLFRNRVSKIKTRKRKQPRQQSSAEVLEDRQLLTAITVTPQEQLLVELVNRARQDPAGEADRFDIGLNDDVTGTPITTDAKQPLALQQILTNVAEAHSQDMIDDNFFAHINTENLGPDERVAAAGYPLDVAENLAIRGTTGTIDPTAETLEIHEGLFRSAGHRANLLGDNHVEIGVGLVEGVWTDEDNIFGNNDPDPVDYNALLGTQLFAQPNLTYITGVAYHDDVTDDDFYTVGEGHTTGTIGILSETDETYIPINSAGGYQIAVPAGDYIVTFNDGVNTYIVRDVFVTDENVKVDFETTTATAQVDIDLTLPTSAAENDGSITGTVTRGNGNSGDISSDYTVNLFAGSGDLSVPAFVVIPAGQHSVDFTITLNDNSTLDGTRLGEIFVDGANAIPGLGSLLITDHETSLVVSGTSGDDTFNYIHEFSPGFHQLTVNGTAYEFAGSIVNLQINGLDGSDTLNLEASSGRDIVNFAPNQVDVTTVVPGLIFLATTTETIRVDANGGTDDQAIFTGQSGANDFAVLKPEHTWVTVPGSYYNFGEGFDLYDVTGGDAGDSVQLYDSPGNDTLIAFDSDSSLVGPGFALQSNSFTNVDIYSVAGGIDHAQFTDSSGDDVYDGRPTQGTLTTLAAVVTAHQFDTYELLGTGGGTDVAFLHDSAGDDTFTSSGTIASLAGAGFEHEINGFDTVVARATAGGNDTAIFNDTFEDDLYVAKHNAQYMSGAGFYNYASDFENSIATSTAGSDTAQLYDSPGTDSLLSRTDHTTITGSGFNNRTEDFGTVLVFSTLGGNDSATFHDSADDDLLVARPDYTYLLNSSQYNYAAGFTSTYAYSTLGGNDTVQFYDSVGDDLYVTKTEYAYLTDTAGTYFNFASGFSATAAYSVSGGFDQAQLYDSTGNDHVVAQSSAVTIDVGATGVQHRAVYFNRVDVWSTNGGTDTVNQFTGLDFEFRRFGSWI